MRGNTGQTGAGLAFPSRDRALERRLRVLTIFPATAASRFALTATVDDPFDHLSALDQARGGKAARRR